MAGLVHALTLLAIILLLAPLAMYVPLATLAAVLFVVAYNMGAWREIGSIWRLDWADRSVWMITFGLTVMVAVAGRREGPGGEKVDDDDGPADEEEV